MDNRKILLQREISFLAYCISNTDISFIYELLPSNDMLPYNYFVPEPKKVIKKRPKSVKENIITPKKQRKYHDLFESFNG